MLKNTNIKASIIIHKLTIGLVVKFFVQKLVILGLNLSGVSFEKKNYALIKTRTKSVEPWSVS
jgi:hypothetical protein